MAYTIGKYYNQEIRLEKTSRNYIHKNNNKRIKK